MEVDTIPISVDSTLTYPVLGVLLKFADLNQLFKPTEDLAMVSKAIEHFLNN